MKIKLSCIEAPPVSALVGQSVELHSGDTIGRSANNQLVLADDSRVVSSRHAELRHDGGQWMIIDLSTNGTFVNSRDALLGKGNQQIIGSGDSVYFGEYGFRVDVVRMENLPDGLEEVSFLDSDSPTELGPALTSPVPEPAAVPDTPVSEPPTAEIDNAAADDLDKWLSPTASPTSTPSPAANASSSVDDGLDDWLDPKKEAPPPMQEMGLPWDDDPVQSLGGQDDLLGSLDSDPNLDPLAAFEEPKRSLSSSAADDDDWWQSSADHAPANQMAMPNPTPVPAPAPSPAQSNDLEDFLATPVSAKPAQAGNSVDDLLGPSESTSSPAVSSDIDDLLGPAPAHSAANISDDLDDLLGSSPTPDIETKPAADSLAQQANDSTQMVSAGERADIRNKPAVEPKPVAAAAPVSQDLIKTVVDKPFVEQKPSAVNPPKPQAAPATKADATPAPDSTAVAADPAQTEALVTMLGLRGLTDEQEAQVVDQCASIVTDSVENLVHLLRSRASIKNELRASATMIQSAENNPLKFSVGSKDALQAMFSNPGGAYLPPDRAVKESFADITDHQIAVLFAIKSAFNHMLQQFKPENLEARFEQGKGKGLLGGLTSKTWENYGQYYESLEKDIEQSYNKMFGEAFADAYEEKIREMKSARKGQ